MTSFCVTSFLRRVGNLIPTLVQNLILSSMDLPCECHFEFFYNQLSVPEFGYYTSTLKEKGLVRVSNSPYVAPIVMVHHLMDLYDCMPISC